MKYKVWATLALRANPIHIVLYRTIRTIFTLPLSTHDHSQAPQRTADHHLCYSLHAKYCTNHSILHYSHHLLQPPDNPTLNTILTTLHYTTLHYSLADRPTPLTLVARLYPLLIRAMYCYTCAIIPTIRNIHMHTRTG